MSKDDAKRLLNTAYDEALHASLAARFQSELQLVESAFAESDAAFFAAIERMWCVFRDTDFATRRNALLDRLATLYLDRVERDRGGIEPGGALPAELDSAEVDVLLESAKNRLTAAYTASRFKIEDKEMFQIAVCAEFRLWERLGQERAYHRFNGESILPAIKVLARERSHEQRALAPAPLPELALTAAVAAAEAARVNAIASHLTPLWQKRVHELF